MQTCTICHFQTELDDVVVPLAGGRCICLRCFGRETESHLPMPKALRQAIHGALAELEPA